MICIWLISLCSPNTKRKKEKKEGRNRKKFTFDLFYFGPILYLILFLNV